MKMALLSLAD